VPSALGNDVASQRTPCLFAPAEDADAAAIYELAFANPQPFLRRVEPADIVRWLTTDDWMCWVAKDLSTGQLLAVCNVKVPEVKAGEPAEPGEFGGLFTDPQTRGRGVGRRMATFALGAYYWDTDPDGPNPLPMLAHVHKDNEAPRQILDLLGFRLEKAIEVPGGTPGFEHMPTNDAGVVVGDEFIFPPEKRTPLFETLADLLDDPLDRFEVPVGMTSAELRRLAAGS
jgi:hypothetical protein